MKFSVLIFAYFSTVWATPSLHQNSIDRKSDGYSSIVHPKDFPVPRIIGGELARAGQFPYSAAIHVQTLDSTWFCGGSILSTLWILTCGHCVDGAVQFTISLGSNTLTEDDFNRVTLSTSSYFLHPNYNNTTMENDIGLIELRSKIQYTDYIGRLYLPVTEYNADVEVTAIGWGQTTDSVPGPVEHLSFVNLVTLSNEICMIYYGPQIYQNMVCAAGNNIEGTCTGDSGTPLIYFLNKRHPIVVGVSIFVSGHGCEGLEPSGYVRIFPYRDWILSITGSLDN